MTKPQIKTWPMIYYENDLLIGAFWLRPNNFSSFQKEGVWRKKNIFWLHGSTKRITFPGLGRVAWRIAKDTVKSLEQYIPLTSTYRMCHILFEYELTSSITLWKICKFSPLLYPAFSNPSAIACFSNFRQCLDVMPAAHYSPCLV